MAVYSSPLGLLFCCAAHLVLPVSLGEVSFWFSNPISRTRPAQGTIHVRNTQSLRWKCGRCAYPNVPAFLNFRNAVRFLECPCIDTKILPSEYKNRIDDRWTLYSLTGFGTKDGKETRSQMYEARHQRCTPRVSHSPFSYICIPGSSFTPSTARQREGSEQGTSTRAGPL